MWGQPSCFGPGNGRRKQQSALLRPAGGDGEPFFSAFRRTNNIPSAAQNADRIEFLLRSLHQREKYCGEKAGGGCAGGRGV